MSQPHRHRSTDRATTRSRRRTNTEPGALDAHRLAADNDGLGAPRYDAARPDELDEFGDFDPGDVATKTKKYVPFKYRVISWIVAGLAGILLALPIIPLIDEFKNGSADDTGSEAATTGSQPATTGTDNNPVSTTTVLEPPASGPYVLAIYDADGLHLTGTVGDQDTSTAVLSAAELYSPNVRSDLAVDSTQPPADWLASAPDVITLLSRSISGTALIADGKVSLAVRVPIAPIAERIERDIAAATNLTVITEQAEITGEQAPVLEVSGTVSQLQLSGRVPTDGIRQATLDAAVDVYGRGNVTSQLLVDDAVHTALWMHDAHGLFEALFVYPEIELEIEGETTTGFVRGGYSFQSGSADAVPISPGVTQFAVDLMNRDPSVIMLIEAHTDTDGPDDANQALSQQRAGTVAGYYVDAGIDPERITAVGKGASELLTEDTTPAGKDRNRRIELKFSTFNSG